jgi:hypothetical protein
LPVLYQWSDSIDRIEKFFISTEHANGLDVVFEKEYIIYPRGILDISLSVARCYHNRPFFFMLRSSITKLNISIHKVLPADNVPMITVQLINESTEQVNLKKRFLVLNIHPYLNCFLGDVCANTEGKYLIGQDFGANSEAPRPIPIEHNKKIRKEKDFS